MFFVYFEHVNLIGLLFNQAIISHFVHFKKYLHTVTNKKVYKDCIIQYTVTKLNVRMLSIDKYIIECKSCKVVLYQVNETLTLS